MKKKIEKVLREFKIELKQLYGDNLVSVILYGSQARGDAKRFSDVDLMLILNEKEDSKEDELFELEFQHQMKDNVLLQTFTAKKDEFETWWHPLYINIRNEGIVL
ncbi:MAG: nucleotidyltransferase domain-containing protein [Cytophagales bacterium]